MIRTAAVCLALSAAPAMAQDIRAHQDGPCIGRIFITNQATGIADQQTHHDFDGIEAVVHYTSTPNYLPGTQSWDKVVVTVPDGFMAVPADITIEEGGTIEVLICEALVG